jgi:hypothetical protein
MDERTYVLNDTAFLVVRLFNEKAVVLDRCRLGRPGLLRSERSRADETAEHHEA